MAASLSFLRSSEVNVFGLKASSNSFSASLTVKPPAKPATISARVAAASSFNLAIISTLPFSAASTSSESVDSGLTASIFLICSAKALSKLAKNFARAASSAGLVSKAASSFGLATGLRTVTPARAGSFTGLSAGLAAGLSAAGLAAAGVPVFTISEIFKVDGVVELSTLSSAFTTEV